MIKYYAIKWDLTKQRVAGKNGVLCEALCCDKLSLCNGVTHPSIECLEKATWEGPDCNSQR